MFIDYDKSLRFPLHFKWIYSNKRGLMSIPETSKLGGLPKVKYLNL